MEAIDKAGYQAGQDVLLALDCASSEFYKDGTLYARVGEAAAVLGQFADYLATLAEISRSSASRTGMAENDWDGWKILTERLGKKIQLVGDDISSPTPRSCAKASPRAWPIRS